MIFEQLADPDYFYHISVSRQIAENGFAATIPQVTGIGWDILYTDKEFLFHLLTALFYKIGGEQAVRFLMPCLFSLSLATFYYFAYTALRQISHLKRPALWALMIFVPVVFDPHFLYRMFMVRPHVFAVLLFIWMALFIMQNRVAWAFAIGFVFSVSYHGVQVPLLLLLCAAVAAKITEEKNGRALGAAFGGLLLGLVLNPYFPGNLVLIEIVTKLIFRVGTSAQLNYGGEVYPWTSLVFLKSNLVIFMTLFGSLVLYPQIKDQKQKFPLLFALLLTACFLFLSAISPRAREYVVPSATLLFLLCTRVILEVRRSTLRWDILAIGICAALQIGFVFSYYKKFSDQETSQLPVYKKALMNIPVTPEGGRQHVFNCSWWQSPYILYYRPDLTFIDILDPSFLDAMSPSLSTLRMDITAGKEIDAYQHIKGAFHAKYTWCDSLPLNQLQENDPRFERIFPDSVTDKIGSASKVRIYRLKETPSYFVKNYDYQLEPIQKMPDIGAASPKTAKAWRPREAVDNEFPDYFDFQRSLPIKAQKDGAETSKESIIECVWLRPTAEEMTKNQGQTFLGIGGGPNVRLWLNGKSWFQSLGEVVYGKPIDVLVPVPPIKPTDELVMLVCPGPQAPYFGVMMSFWSEQKIADTCKEKGSTLTLSNSTVKDWKYWGVGIKTCLAPIAGADYNLTYAK